MKRTVALLILDGWGVGAHDMTNAIYAASPPHFMDLMNRYPSGTLLSHGIAVGLPWETAGTGESGHLTIGAGRTIYQTSVKIMLAVRDGSFFKNPVLTNAFKNVAKTKGSVHLIGSLSEKPTDDSIERLRALVAFAKRMGITRIRIHAITNNVHAGEWNTVSAIKSIAMDTTTKLASLIGRHYATDGTGDEKNKAAYNAILGIGMRTDDPEKYVHELYLHGIQDEFIEPTTIGPDPRGIEEHDTIVFFDCDGPMTNNLIRLLREESDIPKGVTVTKLADVFMNDYPKNTLGSVLADNGKIQFRIAETSRYPHITYFMNGKNDTPLTNEYRILIPQEHVARTDERPEMMTKEIADRGIAAIEEGADFIAMNFAAPDAVAHTGNFEATKRAILAADRELGTIAQAVLARGGALIVTADHGNAERMRNPVTGATETDHNTNPVPVLLIAAELEKIKSGGIPSYEETDGLLSDIAPTVLAFMGLSKPTEMTGSSLISRLS